MPPASATRPAVVFPGQGSQRPGMAADFCERFAVARDAFTEASEALSLDLAALCFAEADPRLDLTEFTQPAILTAEIAMFRALTHELGLSPAWFGGHSLGEYAALCAAGVVPLGVAVRLVRRRGALMQSAVPVGDGAMAAIIAQGIAERDLVRELGDLGVDVANRNSSNQVVLSGPAAALHAACARLDGLLDGQGHEIVHLNVSAPFHSRMMRGIEAEFRAVLESAADRFDPSRSTAVTSNLTGRFHDGTRASLIDGLTRQVSGTVDWIGNMRALVEVADPIFEIGPNRPLRSFFKATVGRDVSSILSVKTAEKALGK